MSALSYAAIVDGPSDRALLPIIRWALRTLRPTLELATPTLVPRRHRPIAESVARTREYYSPDLIFVHRDAENVSHETRRQEIPEDERVVPIVPVRMTEAWLLIDEPAIRRAAGNPNGEVALKLPKIDRLDRLVDPKRLLQETLALASELGPRRRQRFDRAEAAMRVAELVEDFSRLDVVPAFAAFMEELRMRLTTWERVDSEG